MFFKKKYHDIRWDDHENQKEIAKLTISVLSIKHFSPSIFGIKNSSASFDFVPNAMQILGEIQTIDGLAFQENAVSLLVPEENLDSLQPGDRLVLWLSHANKCFKL